MEKVGGGDGDGDGIWGVMHCWWRSKLVSLLDELVKAIRCVICSLSKDMICDDMIG